MEFLHAKTTSERVAITYSQPTIRLLTEKVIALLLLTWISNTGGFAAYAKNVYKLLAL